MCSERHANGRSLYVTSKTVGIMSLHSTCNISAAASRRFKRWKRLSLSIPYRVTENEMTQSVFKPSNTTLQRFDSVVLRAHRHLVNVLTHFTKHASELVLTFQQILTCICENTLQFQTNVRNNRFKYYDKGYLVARLSIGQLFVMQICCSRSVSRSNVYSANM